VGQGPALILVFGALCSRALGPGGPLSALLAEHFTVYNYDRRGRGESLESKPYEVERELEDLEALLAEAGGAAHVYGHSSGAVLALETAARSLALKKLALYEAPLIVDTTKPSTAAQWEQVDAYIAQGRRADALKVFLQMVGMPTFAIAVMRWLPVWAKLTALAHTLPYDGALVRELQRGEPLPSQAWAKVTVPVLGLVGQKSPAWMQNGMRSLANVLRVADLHTLPGQTHDVSAKALAPVLRAFFEPAAR
jgi:pimeloyl-ACP methyl ester carboxylesterase